MATLKKTFKFISVTMVMISLFYLVASTKQTFAASTAPLASPAIDFTCLPAAKIKAPPNLSTSIGSRAHNLRSLCPAGLVPQPVSLSSTTPQQSRVCE